ncbi:leucyl aminopeptidase [Paenactinomyces guangxiensis]|uniref:Probable cytosol aminopeptidase n=1 Tax=Paenactinomyces guangxiensis TaxID=1490290 RepID=A0A7W1WQN3_9BACL|nr:leucyl aminopeptidase [Paenactinomyces guangxiensis]MBA4494288.1 leucyl aminopeptidase [Paenactinomyces guangxiensis]MBH8590782.1 leucyl aminopeptidase [Paenactinomyces guangxiensis]
MEWKLTREPLASLAADAIIVFHTEDRESTQGCAHEVNQALEYRISSLISEGEIRGSLGEVTILHNWGKIPSKRVLVTGLGKEDKTDLRRLKNAVAEAARKAQAVGIKQLGIDCPFYMIERYNSVDVIQAIVEGVELGSYQHHSYKSDIKKKEMEVVWLSLDELPQSVFEAGIERGQVFARATNLARFLAHEPGNYLTPDKLAEQAKQIAEKRGLSIDIFTKDRLAEHGMNGLLAVSRGSANPPRMIILSYYGAPDSKEVLGLVGKGVTFDSGGLQIKPGAKMDTMKGDMAGAAAVLGAMDAIGKLKPHCNVIAIIPACENLTGSDAYRPGDVLQTYSGKTVEVHHTDAEGRIVLADAISYAKRLGATKLVDVATLTGAVVVALGYETAGLMTNDDEWGHEVKTAARIAGERVWELPMYDEYEAYVKSEIADLKNDAGSPAGAIQGGMFLKQFAEDTPLVHLDIAGTASSGKNNGIHPKGATGSSVRTLIQLAMRFG